MKSWHTPQGRGKGERTLAADGSYVCRGPVLPALREEGGREAGTDCLGLGLSAAKSGLRPRSDPDVLWAGGGAWSLLKTREKTNHT